jgi:Protein of unknown function (DUF2442)
VKEKGHLRKVVSVQPLTEYRIAVRFDDEVEGVADISSMLGGELGEPLKNADSFRQVFVNEWGTVCWPNGFDICQDVLYRHVERITGSELIAAEGGFRSLLERLRHDIKARRTPFLDEHSRDAMIREAHEQIKAVHGDSRPFAFSACKVDRIDSIRPDLAGAVQAARKRFGDSSFMMIISAWFPDGSEYVIDQEFVSQFHEDGRLAGWITDEQAHELERKLFGEENG